MTQQFLNGSNVHTIHDQMTGKRMAQVVEAHIFNIGLVGDPSKRMVDIGVRSVFLARGREDVALLTSALTRIDPPLLSETDPPARKLN